MQFQDFDYGDPIFEVDGWVMSFQVITLDNLYVPDRNCCRLEPTKTG